MSWKKLIILIITGLIIFAGGFATGMYYQKKQTLNAQKFPGNFNGQTPPDMSKNNSSDKGTHPSGNNSGPGGNMTSGEIISKSDTSLIIKTSDGNTKTIYYSDSTTVSKNETGSTSDLTVGTNISVSGTTNTDKSVTSKMIMITPAEKAAE